MLASHGLLELRITMIKCVIFDMDGLLSDTEELHYEAYKIALEEYGGTINFEEYVNHWANQGKGLAEFLDLKNLNIDASVLKARKTEIFVQLSKKNAKLFDGAKDLLIYIKSLNLVSALASSASLVEIMSVLKATEVEEYFGIIVSKESVRLPKPHPDIFLKAASLAGVDPTECIVLEDAEKGIKAAKDAGMICIAIPSKETVHGIKTRADLTLDSLKSINLINLLSLQH